MNLDNLVTQDKAESGEWFPVYLYGKYQNFDLKIYGDDSDVVIRHGRKALRKINNTFDDVRSKNKELDDKTIDDLMNDEDEKILIRIAGIRGWNTDGKNRKEEPITLNGVELKNDVKSYKLLIEKIPEIRNFVLKTARDRTNFLSKPSEN